jgi:hypothetical protein
MILAEQKLNSFRQIKRNNSNEDFIQPNIPKRSNVKKLYHIIKNETTMFTF